MKKTLMLLFAGALLLGGCRANFPVAQQSGKEDMAYLLFVSQKQYKGKLVQVKLDNAAPFDAKVVKAKKANRRGSQYGVGVGPRQISVSCEGKNIYHKKIFLSTQEVKQIMLP